MEINEAKAVLEAYKSSVKAERDEMRKMGKFKAGDHVKLKYSDHVYWNDEMNEMEGSIAVVREHLSRISTQLYDIEGVTGAFHEKDMTLATAAEIELFKNRKKTTLSQILRDRLAANGNNAGFATFGIRYSKGAPYIAVKDICHARMRWKEGAEDNEILEICNWVAGYRGVEYAFQKIYDTYLHYILNDSPWAEACITKDIQEAYTNGVMMDVTKNISVIVGACIAMRELWEHEARRRMFSHLMDRGVNGHVAYLVSSYVIKRVDGSYAISGLGGGHMTMHGMMDWKAIKRFFIEGYEKDLTGMGKDPEQTSYQIYNTIVRMEDRDKYYGSRVDKGHIQEVFDKNLDAKVEGEGFAKKTVVNKACIDSLVTFLTKELT